MSNMDRESLLKITRGLLKALFLCLKLYRHVETTVTDKNSLKFHQNENEVPTGNFKSVHRYLP